jgi:CheY-like chemotaxis protein
VDVHLVSRLALASMLERRGYEVLQAESVGDALRSAADHACDLLVSDIGLPDGDGYVLMAELRSRYGMRGIALTGYGMEDDRARSAAAGYFVHLTKPVSIKSLEAALAKFHRGSAAPFAPDGAVES